MFFSKNVQSLTDGVQGLRHFLKAEFFNKFINHHILKAFAPPTEKFNILLALN